MCKASPIAVRESPRCWARWLPMTVKPAACRKLMWMTPDDGVASPGTGDGAHGGAVICWVSIGKGLTSSVVRPSVEIGVSSGAVACL